MSNNNDDEEYHFSEESSSEFQAPRPSMTPPMPEEPSSGRGKKLLLLIGIIAAGFCLYKLYGVFSLSGAQKPKIAMPSVAVVKKVESPPHAAPVVISETAQQNNKLMLLDKSVSQVAQSNAKLQEQVAGLSTAVSDVQNSLANLSQQVSGVTQAMEDIQKEKAEKKLIEQKKEAAAKLAAEKKAAALKKQKRQKALAGKIYYVKAMIQGRAWLATPDGALLTVSENDDLPGYGRILTINPEQTVITTSSGRTLEPHPKDE